MLTIDEATHIYTAEDGHVVHGVTSIMKAEGFHVPFQEDSKAAAWGKTAHKIFAMVGEGALGGYDSVFEPWMRGIKTFFADWMPVGKHEQIVHYVKNGVEYAGTLDLECMLQGPKSKSLGARWIIDVKFWASKTKPTIALGGIQTAAYAEARFGRIHPRRALLWIFQNGYELIECRDNSDFTIWQGILNSFFWKRRHLNGSISVDIA